MRIPLGCEVKRRRDGPRTGRVPVRDANASWKPGSLQPKSGRGRSGEEGDCRAGRPLRPLQAGWRPDHIGGLQGADRDERLTRAVMPSVQQYCEVEHMLGVRLDGLVVELVIIERTQMKSAPASSTADWESWSCAGPREARAKRCSVMATPDQSKTMASRRATTRGGMEPQVYMEVASVYLKEPRCPIAIAQASTMTARNISSNAPFTFRAARSTIICMKRLARNLGPIVLRRPMRSDALSGQPLRCPWPRT